MRLLWITLVLAIFAASVLAERSTNEKDRGNRSKQKGVYYPGLTFDNIDDDEDERDKNLYYPVIPGDDVFQLGGTGEKGDKRHKYPAHQRRPDRHHKKGHYHHSNNRPAYNYDKDDDKDDDRYDSNEHSYESNYDNYDDNYDNGHKHRNHRSRSYRNSEPYYYFEW